MFGYDAQAGRPEGHHRTYRQLVESAECCAIIHAGKPRNPNESSLAELLKAAAPYC